MEKIAITQYVDEDLLNDEYLDRDMARVIANKLLDDGYLVKHVEYKADEMKHLVTWYLRVYRP